MVANSTSSLTPTNTPALTMSSTLPSSSDTTPSSTSTLSDKISYGTPRVNEYFRSPTIKIEIGPEREYWNIPRALLLAKIPCLQPILVPSSTVKDTAGIVMHKEEPSTFAHVVDWMLTGDVCIHQQHHGNEVETELFLPLFALHAFALRFKMQEFAEVIKNKIKTCLFGHHCLPTAGQINQVFSTGEDDTTMKRLIVKGIVDVFLALSPQDLLGGLEGWSKILTSHPEFTTKFLMAVKVRVDFMRVDVEDGKTVVARKRKGQEEAEEEAEREGLEAKRARVVDLTG